MKQTLPLALAAAGAAVLAERAYTGSKGVPAQERQARQDRVDAFYDLLVLPIVLVGAGVQVVHWLK